MNMRGFTIDTQLIDMLCVRRVIPFVGTGFSAALNLPDWDSLLSKVSSEVEGALPYKTVAECCSNDPLQIAEYYLLMTDRNIGPLRYAIEQAFTQETKPILSGPHVELVNLGAPHIYTTNFDDLIEVTFRQLGLPVEVVALPKDVATSSEGKTQVIKYHGDLRHESTLVLTESSYYSRLDFESPMDLKFRSDLLGRSVLFVGYSFRDINIRIIWFKLMQMMKDIPPEDRPTSFIVRLEPNPVLEKLYESVGIKTIVLDPHKKAKSNEAKIRLLSTFMFTLSSQIAPDGKIPGTREQQFVSIALLDTIRENLIELKGHKEDTFTAFMPKPFRGRTIHSSRLGDLENLINILEKRRIPEQLGEQCKSLLDDFVSKVPNWDLVPSFAGFAKRYGQQFGSTPGLTLLVSLGLGDGRLRRVICTSDMPWKAVWGSRLSNDQATVVLRTFETALSGPEFLLEYKETIENIAYLADPVIRILEAQIVEKQDRKSQDLAKKLLRHAHQKFPLLKSYKPSLDGRPAVTGVVKKIMKDLKTKNG
jgi:hypothetical protein